MPDYSRKETNMCHYSYGSCLRRFRESRNRASKICHWENRRIEDFQTPDVRCPIQDYPVPFGYMRKKRLMGANGRSFQRVRHIDESRQNKSVARLSPNYVTDQPRIGISVNQRASAVPSELLIKPPLPTSQATAANHRSRGTRLRSDPFWVNAARRSGRPNGR